MAGNYPPGVTGNEPQICGDEAWERVFDCIQDDANKRSLSATDVLFIWHTGLANRDHADAIAKNRF